MKKVLLVFSLFGLVSAGNAKDLDEYMDEMKKPYKSLKRAIKKDAASAHSLRLAKDFILVSQTFAKFKHEEDKFNKMNEDFQKAIELFQQAVETKKADELKKTFRDVKKTCNDCHDVYDA